ncbi:hypothetical protein MKX08_001342 [Trichoderma sp. CBMAI-0020]|nr:hypothetical protein MKX08_001342 [Trichoderma sp. CBMAI-0020]
MSHFLFISRCQHCDLGMFKPALFTTKSNSTVKATEISSFLTLDIMDRVTDKAGLGYYTVGAVTQTLACLAGFVLMIPQSIVFRIVLLIRVAISIPLSTISSRFCPFTMVLVV